MLSAYSKASPQVAQELAPAAVQVRQDVSQASQLLVARLAYVSTGQSAYITHWLIFKYFLGVSQDKQSLLVPPLQVRQVLSQISQVFESSLGNLPSGHNDSHVLVTFDL